MTRYRRIIPVLIVIFVLAAVLAGAALTGIHAISAGSLGLRESAKILLGTGLGVLRQGEVQASSRGEYTNIFFLHHSVGSNLINEGNLREQFQKAGISLWDQGYRYDGMRGPDGQNTGFWYPVPGDNTDPVGLVRVFTQTPRSLPVNALSGLLQHEVILFKSCYPNSNISGPEQMVELQQMYLGMRTAIDQHPDKVFILLTTPPLNPVETQLENARYARQMAEWLQSEEFLAGRENFFVFDFYSLLAENDPASPEYGMLKAAYRSGADSHPNAAANLAVAPQLVDFVRASIDTYRGD